MFVYVLLRILFLGKENSLFRFDLVSAAGPRVGTVEMRGKHLCSLAQAAQQGQCLPVACGVGLTVSLVGLGQGPLPLTADVMLAALLCDRFLPFCP